VSAFEHLDRPGSCPTTRADRPVEVAVLLCFFLSGSSALIYEVTWSRLLVHVFGATMLAVSTVLAVFMAGLAIGAWFVGRSIDSRVSTRSDLLKLYAFLELCIGVYALATPLIFGQSALSPWWQILNRLLWESTLLLPSARLLTCLAVLIIPTALIGGTLPVLSRFAALGSGSAQRRVNCLYATNTAGAMAGTILGGFALLPRFGLAGTVTLAAVTNLFVGLMALALRRNVASSSLSGSGSTNSSEFSPERSFPQPLAADQSRTAAVPSFMVALLLVVAIAGGAIAMILEVCWTRLFSLVLSSTAYAFSAVLAIYLVGLAAGAGLVAFLHAHVKRPYLVMAITQFLAGSYIYLSLLVFDRLPWLYLLAERTLVRITGGLSFETAVLARAALAAAVILPPALLLGCLFPLLVRLVVVSMPAVGRVVGRLYALNTAGAVVGAWLAGFVLIPRLSEMFVSGIESTLILGACLEICLAAASLACWRLAGRPGRGERLMVYSATICLLASLAILGLCKRPGWNTAIMSSGVSFYGAGERASFSRDQFLHSLGLGGTEGNGPAAQVLFYREGLNTTVTVGSEPAGNVIYLKNDGKVDATVPADPGKPAPNSNMITQILLGQLPVLVHPGAVARALVIGYGSGTSVGSMLQSPSVDQVVVAELEEAVLAANRFFVPANNNPLHEEWLRSERVRPVIADARNLLAVGAERFDVIVSQPAEPWLNGMGDLFTREFWQLGRSRLADRGVFCQWIQLYGITPEYLGVLCRTFRAVFPESLVFHPPGAGEIILIGFRGQALIDVRSFSQAFARSGIRRDLLRVGIQSPEQILSMLAQGSAELEELVNGLGRQTGDRRLNTDDNLLVEYALPRELYDLEGSLPANLRLIDTPELKPERYWRNYGGEALERAAFLSRLSLAYLAHGPFSGPANAKVALHLARTARRSARSPATLMAEATALDRVGQVAAAQAERRALTGMACRSAADYLAVGTIWQASGESAQAERSYRQAVAAEPAWVEPHLELGRLYLRDGQPGLALAEFVSASKLDALCVRAAGGQGFAYAQLKDRSLAEAAWRKALSLDPTQFKIRLALGKLLFETGRAEQGLEELAVASRQDPASPLPYLHATIFHMQARNWRAAMSNLQRLRERASCDSRGDLLAALILDEVGQQQEADRALDSYERACGHKVSQSDLAAELKRVVESADLSLLPAD